MSNLSEADVGGDPMFRLFHYTKLGRRECIIENWGAKNKEHMGDIESHSSCG
jgi:hypothetical protein